MSLESCTAEMLEAYSETNNDYIDLLSEEPTPLDFMRYVAKNRPFIVKQGCSTWPAVRKWNIDYMLQKMGDAKVDIAQTPYG